MMKPLVISGSGGMGKSGRGSSGGGGTEAPNSLRSSQVARVIDLISEGPIGGLKNGAQDIYLDGVRIQNPNGSNNFSNVGVAVLHGWPDQPFLSGFPSQEAETAVSQQLKYGLPLTRSILNTDADRVRITVSVPSLQHQDRESGDINGSTVTMAVYIQNNGGGYLWQDNITISGKTNTRYQRSTIFTLPRPGPWDIQIVRQTADSQVQELQDETYWDSYTTIIDDKVNYNLSAVVAMTVDAEQFSSVPKRAYDVYGLIVAIPSNYDPLSRTYSGVWNGTFKFDWTNNPAWVFYDLLTNTRYGLGNFLTHLDIDKWSLYSIAQWCDGIVPNGRGGWEPRFVCNAVIKDQQEAFDLLASMASVFRGFAYWAGGQMIAVGDIPSDPVAVYTNANVVDGVFTYAGGDVRSMHNQALVSWNDPANLGEPRIAIVEDVDGISRLGIQATELEAVGTTSEGQAVRIGRWTLYTEQYESEVVTFAAGLEAAWVRPGDIFQIADLTVGGERRGGRVVSATPDHVVLDYPVNVPLSGGWSITCQMPDGRVETRAAASSIGYTVDIYPTPPFSMPPNPDSVWVHSTVDLQPTLWRCTGVKEKEAGGVTYEITGVRHRPDKWAHVESDVPLADPDISNVGGVPEISAIHVSDYLVALSAISIGSRMLVSWTSRAPVFNFAWRRDQSNWNTMRTDQASVDVPVEEGWYDIEIQAINGIGRRGPVSRVRYLVIGASAPPQAPSNFRVQQISGIAMLQWAPSTELDVIIGGTYELRYSPRTVGAVWTSANTLISQIPGTATTVEVAYRPGTYLLRTRDIRGSMSLGVAVIVTTAPDTTHRPFVRICEHPTWPGERRNTIVQAPQDWLIIAQNAGGVWDDQTDDIDSWPTVDVLPIGPSGQASEQGYYEFEHRIDMGGVFDVRLTRDMLAFPISTSEEDFIDSRPGNVDDWQEWDDPLTNLSGMVTTLVRQTDDDPASPSAVWSEWNQFVAGNYIGRGFEFQAWLTAGPGENIAIEELCVLADITSKVDQESDIPWSPSKMTITFGVKFYSIPSLSVAIQDGIEGDRYRITGKTREKFDLELLDSFGSPITTARTFDWIASGY